MIRKKFYAAVSAALLVSFSVACGAADTENIAQVNIEKIEIEPAVAVDEDSKKETDSDQQVDEEVKKSFQSL